jgi:hypothetical protein
MVKRGKADEDIAFCLGMMTALSIVTEHLFVAGVLDREAVTDDLLAAQSEAIGTGQIALSMFQLMLELLENSRPIVL